MASILHKRGMHPHDSVFPRCGPFVDPAVHIAGVSQGALAGLSFAVKDLFDIAGRRTGAGNPDWRRTHTEASETAPALSRLLAAGASLAGVTHTDELAFSLEGSNHHYGAPPNPVSPDRLAGGSSSGSAAAVAACFVDFALGTDTGGSVRVPAAFCGLFGFRPTHGSVPVAGIVPLAPSYDTAGWFARDLATLAQVGKVLLPPADATPRRARWLLDPALFAIADPQVGAALEAAVRMLADVETVDSGMADMGALAECYRVTQGAEIHATHGAWIAHSAPRFGPTIAERFADAARIGAEELRAAVDARAGHAARLRALLGDDGILLLPAAPTTALSRNAGLAGLGSFYRRALGLGAIAGFAGAPELVVPAGDAAGLPVGLGAVGPPHADRWLLDQAAALLPLCQRFSPPAP